MGEIRLCIVGDLPEEMMLRLCMVTLKHGSP